MSEQFFRKKKNFFDNWASFYDIIFTTIFYQAIQKRLLEYVHLPPHAFILDLGCGTGHLLRKLATNFDDLRGIGLDLSTQMLREARKKNKYKKRIIFKQGNANQLPFSDNQFDAVFNTISFLHYPNPEQVLAEISRVVRHNGYFYLVDYPSNLGASQSFISPGGLRFYSKNKREELGKKANLICVQHIYLIGPVLLTIFRNQKEE